MRAIAIVNQKGGTGKTTTAVNLAAALAEKGRNVLLIDLDPQYSTTTWYAVTNPGRGVFDLFAEQESTQLTDLFQKTATPNVTLVASSAWLVGAEKALSSEPGAETILREKIGELAPGSFAYVLIDCPPTLGILTVNALTAAREVLVPVECHVMGLQGLAQLLQTVDVVRKRLNPKPSGPSSRGFCSASPNESPRTRSRRVPTTTRRRTRKGREQLPRQGATT